MGRILRRGAVFLIAAMLFGQAEELSGPLVVVLIGPPASGKTTQANHLHRKYQLPVLSVEDMVAERMDREGEWLDLDRTDPALDAILKKHLTGMDTSRGFVLDGYPATRKQADYLAGLLQGMELPNPIVIQINVPDQVAHERCRARGGPDDQPEMVALRLKRYHKEMDFLRSYYPEADIWTIDGTRDEAGVSATVRVLIEDRME